MKENFARSNDWLWLSLALFPLITLSFLFSIHAFDYWWYLRVAQDTLINGTIPSVDTISWTRAGEPVIYQAWLAGLIFLIVNNLGGAPLTYLLRGLVLGLTFGNLWFLARHRSNVYIATLVILIAGAASANNWEMRPQLFTYPLFAFCLYCLLRWQDGENRTIWFLPLITILWSNIHGSYALIFVLTGAALLFGKGDRQPLAIVLGVMVVGTLFTPYGLNLWRYLTFMLQTPSNQLFSLEWAPPRNEGWQMNVFFGWMLVMAPLAAFSGRKLSLLEWILFLGFGWLALSRIRHIIWFLLIVSVLTPSLLSGLLPAWKIGTKKAAPVLNFALAVSFMLLPLFFLPGIREKWWDEAPPTYALSSNPIAATDWLRQHPELPGPMWNDFAYGSYLAFALPTRPTWLDTRFYVFPPEQMEQYQQISHASNGWDTVLQEQGINLLFLSKGGQAELIAKLDMTTWCVQYQDKYAIIFARCQPIQ